MYTLKNFTREDNYYKTSGFRIYTQLLHDTNILQ